MSCIGRCCCFKLVGKNTVVLDGAGTRRLPTTYRSYLPSGEYNVGGKLPATRQGPREDLSGRGGADTSRWLHRGFVPDARPRLLTTFHPLLCTFYTSFMTSLLPAGGRQHRNLVSQTADARHQVHQPTNHACCCAGTRMMMMMMMMLVMIWLLLTSH